MPSTIDEKTPYSDVNGKPLVNGKIYIGIQGQDPILNPLSIFSNRALTIGLANPQTLDSNGRSVNKIWVPGKYSLRVDDSADVQHLIDLDAGETTAIGTTPLTNVQGADTITANASPTIVSYVDQQQFVFTAVANNTGPTTINIDGVGAKDIRDSVGQPLTADNLISGNIVNIFFNATSDFFQLAAPGASGIPSGSVLDFAGSAAPIGWVFCDGSTFNSVSDPTFANLFLLIGTTFGGTGAADFDVPDLRGRAAIGLDNLGGVSANRIVNTQADSLGGSAGAETQALALANLASHTHTGPNHTHAGPNHTHTIASALGTAVGGGAAGAMRTATVTSSFNTGAASGTTGAAGTGATGATGSGTAFDKTQPWIAMVKIIKK